MEKQKVVLPFGCISQKRRDRDRKGDSNESPEISRWDVGEGAGGGGGGGGGGFRHLRGHLHVQINICAHTPSLVCPHPPVYTHKHIQTHTPCTPTCSRQCTCCLSQYTCAPALAIHRWLTWTVVLELSNCSTQEGVSQPNLHCKQQFPIFWCF